MNNDTTLTISTFEDTSYNPNNPEEIANFWKGANITYQGKIIGTAKGQDEIQQKTGKIPVMLHLSSEVVKHFRATGNDWQLHIDKALRDYIYSNTSHHH